MINENAVTKQEMLEAIDGINATIIRLRDSVAESGLTLLHIKALGVYCGYVSKLKALGCCPSEIPELQEIS